MVGVDFPLLGNPSNGDGGKANSDYFSTGMMRLRSKKTLKKVDHDEMNFETGSDRHFSKVMNKMKSPSVEPLSWNPHVTFNVMVCKQIVKFISA